MLRIHELCIIRIFVLNKLNKNIQVNASIFSLGAQKKEKIMNKSDSDKDKDTQ